VSTYDDYLTGRVYGYTISISDENEDADEDLDEIDDSCWGYYLGEKESARDDDSYLAQEARSVIDHHLATVSPDGNQTRLRTGPRRVPKLSVSCQVIPAIVGVTCREILRRNSTNLTKQ